METSYTGQLSAAPCWQPGDSGDYALSSDQWPHHLPRPALPGPGSQGGNYTPPPVSSPGIYSSAEQLQQQEQHSAFLFLQFPLSNISPPLTPRP